jgi:hypothetical protein
MVGTPMIAVPAEATPRRQTRAPHARVPTLTTQPDEAPADQDDRPYGLAPQKIFFPSAGSPALLPGVKQYAGQQLLTGAQAKAYANDFIGVHVTKIADGQTYAQVSAKSQADPKNATLTAQKTALFQGETLRGASAQRLGLVRGRHDRDAGGHHPDRGRRHVAPAALGQLARQPAQPHLTGLIPSAATPSPLGAADPGDRSPKGRDARSGHVAARALRSETSSRAALE